MQKSVEEKLAILSSGKEQRKKNIWNDVLQEMGLDFGSRVKPRWKEHNGSNHQAILPGCMQHEQVLKPCVHHRLLRITVPMVSVEGEAAPAVSGLQELSVS